MLIHATAQIRLQSDSLLAAIREFLGFVKQYLTAGPNGQLSIGIVEAGSRANAILAGRLPDDTMRFSLGRIYTDSPLTAAQFLESIGQAKPKRSSSQVQVEAAAFDVLELFEEIAHTLPASGRGILLLLNLTDWRMQGDDGPAAIRAGFSRFRHGTHTMSASITVSFQALSLKDPLVAETIASVSDRLALNFSKPVSAFSAGGNTKIEARVAEGSDPRLRSASAEEQLVMVQTFREALARAADQTGTGLEDLERIPLLFTRGAAFDKRVRDVRAGKKENVNFPAILKRFMKVNFPEYCFDGADPEQIWFRRPMASTLEFLLMFEKVHQWGLGKSFTLHFATDFPNTPFGGMHRGLVSTRKNIFWMLHAGWEQRAWAYTTRTELETALQGAGEFLRRVLPVTERQCRDLLSPTPATLPAGTPEHGALSARQAYELVRPRAYEWAADAQLQGVNAMSINEGDQSVAPVTEEGRLRKGGKWAMRFLSKRLDRSVIYDVPYAGRLWWDFHSVSSGSIPKYDSVLESDDWIDSTKVASRGFEQVRKHLGDFRPFYISLGLRDPKRYSGVFLWELQCFSQGPTSTVRRDITVQLDPRTGEVVGTTIR